MTLRLKTLLLAATVLAAPALTAAAATVESAVYGKPESVGEVNLSALAAGIAGGPAPGRLSPSARRLSAPEFREMPFRTMPHAAGSALGAKAAAVPSAATLEMTSLVSGALQGFNGVDHADQRNADNGNQFSLEPPDQALAVGNGYVVEVVNNALNVYDTTGASLLAGPVSTNRFFNQTSEINRGYENQRGPFLSDPRAFYDADMQRFIIVEWATLNDASGNPLNISVQFLAVSETSDPTGTYRIYSYETTNSAVAGCPCFPDYQQIGVDKNGLFITANLFGIAAPSPFAGAKIYAVSKTALANGTAATIVEFPALPNDFTIHPTVVPPGGNFASAGKGTEYLVESEADVATTNVATSVNVFAISNTSSLNKAAPSLTLSSVSAPTQLYGNDNSGALPPAEQMDGPRPLGGSGPGGLNQPAPLLNADDARVGSNPVYVNGRIWAVIGTAVTSNQYVYNAVAWFGLNVKGAAGAVQASVYKQGIITASPRVSLIYPTVAMPVNGKGAIGVTVSGPAMFPSTAVIPLSGKGVAGSIMLSGVGALPDDGFTAYPSFGGAGVGRWGDYSATAVDEFGTIWLANEYIPDTALYPRTTLANWGTYVTHYVQP